MDLRMLLDLLLGTSRTHAAISREMGCDRRTVRRYRRILDASDLTAAHLDGLDAESLGALFNPRSSARRHARPDFDALAAAHPGSSSRFRYSQYRVAAVSAGEPPMSLSQFNRLRLEHEAMEQLYRDRGVASEQTAAVSMEANP